MTETSRSPYNVMASVRGMGVAVMTRMCAPPPPGEGLYSYTQQEKRLVLFNFI